MTYVASPIRRHRATKAWDSRAKGFGDVSAELDATEPGRLRLLVDAVMQRHLPPHELEALRVAEQDERRMLNGLVGMLRETGYGEA